MKNFIIQNRENIMCIKYDDSNLFLFKKFEYNRISILLTI